MEAIAFLEWFFTWASTVLIYLNVLLLFSNLTFWFMNGTSQRRNTVYVNGSAKGKKLMVVIGSGGHTTEMLTLLSGQDDLFSERTYVIAQTDLLSTNKVKAFERIHMNKYDIRTILRAREVGQCFVSSIGSSLVALWHSSIIVWKEKPDIVICNGPAIAFGLCLFARFFDLCRIHRCRIVFVESICRVQKLSLTGRLIYHLRIAHSFLVQWSELQRTYPRSEYVGRLV